MKRNIYYVIGIFLIAIIAFFVWQRDKEFVPVENPDKELRGQAYLDYWEDLNEAYKKDTYGGATPEETLNLFIEALKAGDLELASKYFVVEKQKIYLKALNNWTDNKTIETVIDYLSKAISSKEFSNELKEFQMVVVEENNQASIVIDFVVNSYTGKWKIYEF